MHFPGDNWHDFQSFFSLSDEQIAQFKTYYQRLVEYNDVMNLTAITQELSVIAYHFADSLALSACLDITKISTIADIGSGAGFPGIPLKIKYPHLRCYLIEVTQKRVQFLQAIIEELGLQDIEVIDLDWRTFIRKTNFDIQVFCSRASLHPEELLRGLQPGSPYKDARIIYWAAADWQGTEKEKLSIEKECEYKTKHKKRKLIVFKRS